MNIHPILVHFPIALLMLYCALEFIRPKKLLENPAWFYIKFSLVALGSVAGLLTLETGSIARSLLGADRRGPIVSAHEFWGQMTIALFCGIAGCYLIAWLRKHEAKFLPSLGMSAGVWKILVWLQKFFIESYFVIFLAVLGIVGLTTTGALGGYIVYKTNSDQITQIIVRLVIGQ